MDEDQAAAANAANAYGAYFRPTSNQQSHLVLPNFDQYSDQPYHPTPPSPQPAEASSWYDATSNPQKMPCISDLSPFYQSTSSIPPQPLAEHVRGVDISMITSPPEFSLPPIISAPTPDSDEELKLFRIICLHMDSFSEEMRTIFITCRPTNCDDEQLSILDLALVVCRYPEEATMAINILSKVILRMMARFMQWRAAVGIMLENWSEFLEPQELVKNMKSQALREVIRTDTPPDLEHRWLFTLLRAVGDIPQLWDLTGSPRHPSGEQGVPFAPQCTTPRVPAYSYTPYHSPPDAGASQPWGKGYPASGGYRTPPASADRHSTPASRLQPVHPSISRLPIQGNRTTASQCQSLSSTHPLMAGGPPSSVANTTMPMPRTSRPLGYPEHFRAYRGSSTSIHSLATTSASSRTSHRSSLLAQPVGQKFDLILQYETLRLLQMETLEEKAKHMAGLVFRCLGTETLGDVTKSQQSPVCASVIKETPDNLKKIAICMHQQLRYEAAMLKWIM